MSVLDKSKTVHKQNQLLVAQAIAMVSRLMQSWHTCYVFYQTQVQKEDKDLEKYEGGWPIRDLFTSFLWNRKAQMKLLEKQAKANNKLPDVSNFISIAR
jgi:hypothetical protein